MRHTDKHRIVKSISFCTCSVIASAFIFGGVLVLTENHLAFPYVNIDTIDSTVVSLAKSFFQLFVGALTSVILSFLWVINPPKFENRGRINLKLSVIKFFTPHFLKALIIITSSFLAIFSVLIFYIETRDNNYFSVEEHPTVIGIIIAKFIFNSELTQTGFYRFLGN